MRKSIIEKKKVDAYIDNVNDIVNRNIEKKRLIIKARYLYLQYQLDVILNKMKKYEQNLELLNKKLENDPEIVYFLQKIELIQIFYKRIEEIITDTN